MLDLGLASKESRKLFFARWRMQIISRTTVVETADLISGILNWVCPGCGGKMGGPGKEFKCQGECLTDWRLIWERMVSAHSSAPSKSRSDRFGW